MKAESTNLIKVATTFTPLSSRGATSASSITLVLLSNIVAPLSLLLVVCYRLSSSQCSVGVVQFFFKLKSQN